MFKASLATRHFTFEAYGATELKAQAAMLRGLERHLKQYPAARIREMMADAEVHFFELDACYRDRDLIAQNKQGEE